MRAVRTIVAITAAVAGAAVLHTGVGAYSTYAHWGSNSVTFYVNPVNADVSQSAAIAALQAGMDVWNTQAGTSFRYQYGGTASDTSTRYDNRNVVFFRNSTNGGAIATTYSWWDSNNRMLDADIVVWDGGFRFFTGTSGCGTYANAAYLEDVATHEFGHALGLSHSSSSGATMRSGYSYCSQTQRTLASDDINGAKALYPPTATSTNEPVAATSQRTLAVQKVTNLDSGRAILTWAGVSGTSVDIYRNGTRLTNTSNDGYFKNYLTLNPAKYTYKVCASGTQTCTNTASITF